MLLLHPEMEGRSCEVCKTYLFGSDGVLRRDRTGKPLKRLPDANGRITLPCATCPKIPMGRAPIPENAIELTAENEQVYEFYKECKAVGKWPEDPSRILYADAAIISEVENFAKEALQEAFMLRLVTLGQLGKK